MTGSKTADRATVGTDFALDAQLVDEQGHDVLRVPLALVRTERLQEAPRALPVASIVPAEHVDVALKEKVEPVSVRTRDHLLVVEGVWVAHDHRGLREVLWLLLEFKWKFVLFFLLVLKVHTFFVSSRGVTLRLRLRYRFTILLRPTIKRDRIIDQNFFLARAREKHAINFVAIRPIQRNRFSIKRLHQNVLSLVQAAKN